MAVSSKRPSSIRLQSLQSILSDMLRVHRKSIRIMGIYFSSLSLEALQISSTSSAYSTSYGFAATDTNDFGIPATFNIIPSPCELMRARIWHCSYDGPADIL